MPRFTERFNDPRDLRSRATQARVAAMYARRHGCLDTANQYESDAHAFEAMADDMDDAIREHDAMQDPGPDPGQDPGSPDRPHEDDPWTRARDDGRSDASLIVRDTRTDVVRAFYLRGRLS